MIVALCGNVAKAASREHWAERFKRKPRILEVALDRHHWKQSPSTNPSMIACGNPLARRRRGASLSIWFLLYLPQCGQLAKVGLNVFSHLQKAYRGRGGSFQGTGNRDQGSGNRDQRTENSGVHGDHRTILRRSKEMICNWARENNWSVINGVRFDAGRDGLDWGQLGWRTRGRAVVFHVRPGGERLPFRNEAAGRSGTLGLWLVLRSSRRPQLVGESGA